jgi:hypothetical protein
MGDKMASTELENKLDQQVVLEGVAKDAKAGAVIETHDNRVVYLRGMKEWPDDFLNESVVVTGTLRRGRIYPGVKVEDGLISQGIKGEQWFLEVEGYEKK